MHIDTVQCPTAAELIKIATDKREQLQASNVTDLSKLVRAELHKQSQRRFANVQLANIEEEELELDSLTADTKPVKAPGTYPYPLATNCSRKTPPRPCHNCRSLYHYDRDCTSWRKLGSSNKKPRPNSKANNVYHKSYVAMTERNDSDYEALCATFYTIIDNDTPNDVVVAETFTVGYQPLTEEALGPKNVESNRDANLVAPECDYHGNNLLVNTALLNELHLPEEGVYEPKRIWERPAGHAVKGIDAT